MKMNKLIGFVAILILAVAFVGCSDDDDDNSPMTSPTMDIVETAQAAGTFNTLVTAVQAANLVETLKSDGPFTVFAPTDDAFAALPAGTIEALLADIPTLSSILTYHVVADELTASEVVNLNTVPTVNGQSAQITVNGSTVMIDGAMITTTDILCTNGVIHVIDAVILPQ